MKEKDQYKRDVKYVKENILDFSSMKRLKYKYTIRTVSKEKRLMKLYNE